MVSDWLIPFLVVYAYAGWQTWRLMFLLDPDPRDCEISKAMARGEAVWPVLLLFIACWPLLFFYSWLNEEPEPVRVETRKQEG